MNRIGIKIGLNQFSLVLQRLLIFLVNSVFFDFLEFSSTRLSGSAIHMPSPSVDTYFVDEVIYLIGMTCLSLSFVND